MVTLNHRKEALSVAFIQAIAAKAGVNVSTRVHDYGVDGSFHDVDLVEGRLQERGFSIDYQAKASKQWHIEQSTGLIHYSLESKNYNTMVERNAAGNHAQLFCLSFFAYRKKKRIGST